jgi:hypothetical protein
MFGTHEQHERMKEFNARLAKKEGPAGYAVQTDDGYIDIDENNMVSFSGFPKLWPKDEASKLAEKYRALNARAVPLYERKIIS